MEKGQLLARVIKSEIVQIELAKEMGVKIKDVVKYLLKKKGDKVQIGEIIAKYKNLFSTKVLKSPVCGEVIHFNPEEGTLGIAVLIDTREIKSVVKGEIVDRDSADLTIKFEGEEFTGQKGNGEKDGVLLMVQDKNEFVDIFGLTKDFCNAVILGEKWSKEALAKAAALECGVIGVEFPVESEIATSNNQNNFGILEISQETFDKLKKLVNKRVFLSGDLKILIYQP